MKQKQGWDGIYMGHIEKKVNGLMYTFQVKKDFPEYNQQSKIYTSFPYVCMPQTHKIFPAIFPASIKPYLFTLSIVFQGNTKYIICRF